MLPDLGDDLKNFLPKMKNYIVRIMYPKGQLISKCLFGAIVSTKKPTKFF